MTSVAGLFNTVPNDLLGFWANQTLRPRKVAEFLDLDKADVARFSNVAESSVRFDDKVPREVMRHLEEVAIICALVADFFRGNVAKTGIWFRTRNPMLGELSPRDMIRYGRMEKLMQIVQEARAANGMPEANVQVQIKESRHGAPRAASSKATH
jgi:hypothetical protein